MSIVYYDSEYHCHTTDPYGTYQKAETSFFDGKCTEYVEGFCYDTSEGYVQIYPWKPMDELDAAQREYERELLADAENALAIMWGGVTV